MKKVISIILFFLLVLSAFILYKTFLVKERPNIILISIDTLRQDHIGVYGYKRDTTPFIDEVASEGIVFKNSFSAAPWTLPSHMSMFTGLPPSVHNVDMDNRILDNTKVTFTEVLERSGYETGGFFSAIYLQSFYGFSRGFSVYSNEIQKKADEITDKVLEWIKKKKRKKFFLFIHYFDVHWPYRPPLKFAEKFGVDVSKKRWFKYGKLMFLRKFSNPSVKMSQKIKNGVIDLYDAGINYVDSNIGRLTAFLKKEGLYDNSVIIITSDHGEEFKEHGSFGHYHQLHSELINVPMIIRYPSKIKGRSMSDITVSSVDIASTIMEIALIKIPAQFLRYGRSILKVLKEKKNNKMIKHRDIIIETRKGSTHHFAFIKDGHKYISPYLFQPITKAKRWISINEQFYNFKEDKSDFHDLFEKELNKVNKEISVDTFRSGVNEYAKKNISGLRIVFISTSDKKKNIFSGIIDTGSVLKELPFVLNFDKDDRLVEDKDNHVIKFRVSLNNKKKEIFFRLNKELKELKNLNLSVSSSGDLLIKKKIDVSRLNKSLMLYKSSHGSIFIIRSGNSGKIKHTVLSEEDKAALKSLGYIN